MDLSLSQKHKVTWVDVTSLLRMHQLNTCCRWIWSVTEWCAGQTALTVAIVTSVQFNSIVLYYSTWAFACANSKLRVVYWCIRQFLYWCTFLSRMKRSNFREWASYQRTSGRSGSSEYDIFLSLILTNRFENLPCRWTVHLPTSTYTLLAETQASQICLSLRASVYFVCLFSKTSHTPAVVVVAVGKLVAIVNRWRKVFDTNATARWGAVPRFHASTTVWCMPIFDNNLVYPNIWHQCDNVMYADGWYQYNNLRYSDVCIWVNDSVNANAFLFYSHQILCLC